MESSSDRDFTELVELPDKALAPQIPPTIAITSTTATTIIIGACLTAVGFFDTVGGCAGCACFGFVSCARTDFGSGLGAGAAYFLNPYVGLGLRARINSTAVTPRWNGTDDIWTSGLLHYDPVTNQYSHPDPFDANYKHSTTTHKDQLSSFDVMGGVYGQLPLNKRMSLGGKLLFGHRQSGDVWYMANFSGNDDYEDQLMGFLNELTKVDEKKDINTYDRIKAIDLDGRGSFIFGTGSCFSYALKHNIVWRVGIDYDFTRALYNYDYQSISLTDMANHYLLYGEAADDTVVEQEGRFHRNLHQLTPSFGICFSF